MADVPNRDELEKRIGRRMAGIQREALAMVMDALGDPPDRSKLTREFWEGIRQRYDGALLVELEAVYMQGAQTLQDGIGVPIDFDIVNERAAMWARTHAATTASQIILNTGNRTLPIIEDYYRTQMTLGDLTQRIAPLFGVDRAQSIAITEITRASVQGERAYANALKPRGVTLAPLHETNNDSRVCPICGPRHKQPITDERYPPLHPRCRCGVNWIIEQIKHFYALGGVLVGAKSEAA